MKSIGFFLVANFILMIMFNYLLTELAAEGYLQALSKTGMFIAAMVVALGCAFTALAYARKICMRVTEAKMMKEPSTPDEIWLSDTVGRMAEEAGLAKPKLATYTSVREELFMAGLDPNDAVLGISRSLLDPAKRAQAEEALDNEISRYAKGLLKTVALIQALINLLIVLYHLPQ